LIWYYVGYIRLTAPAWETEMMPEEIEDLPKALFCFFLNFFLKKWGTFSHVFSRLPLEVFKIFVVNVSLKNLHARAGNIYCVLQKMRL
jgi:hypothetical protein